MRIHVHDAAVGVLTYVGFNVDGLGSRTAAADAGASLRVCNETQAAPSTKLQSKHRNMKAFAAW